MQSDVESLEAQSRGTSTTDLEERIAFLEGAIDQLSSSNYRASQEMDIWDARYVPPAGVIYLWAGSVAPSGYQLCDGTAISRTDNAALFSAIGTTYGVGDGSTTFNVPNLKGRVPVGRDAAQTEFDVLGETGGAKTHTLTTGEMPSHNHTQNAHDHAQFVSANPGTGGPGVRLDWNNDATGLTAYPQGINTGSTVATNQATGGGGAHNNLQPYMALNYIIKL